MTPEDYMRLAWREVGKLRDLVELRTLERDEARDAAKRALDWVEAESMKYVAARGDLSRALARRAGLVKPEPAIGATASWATVWDHLKAEPLARYEAVTRSGGARRRDLRMVAGAVRGPVGPHDWVFCSTANLALDREWTFTRLPDAQEK